MAESGGESATLEPAARPARRIRVRAAEPLLGALRRILTRQMARLRQLQSAAMAADEEAIHDMRVAIRRSRAGLRIAQPHVRRQLLRPLRRGLRDAARALGAVRDLDVILAHIETYRSGNPESAGGLTAWVAELQARREEARLALHGYLTGKAFGRTLKAFRAFLAHGGPKGGEAAPDATDGPPSESPETLRVRDLLPAIVWAQYGSVRAYEVLQAPPLLTLHALRIEIKRLRYLLEFFEGVLGIRVRPDIDRLTRTQDHLGQLHDASVAIQMLRTYVAANASAPARDFSAAAAYLAALEREIEERTQAVPALHAEIACPPFRRRLGRFLSRF
jgi:CHAD domain-containing protein